MYTFQSFASISTSSSFLTSIITIFSAVRSVISVFSVFSPSLVASLAFFVISGSVFSSFLFSPFPWFFGEEIAFDIEGSVISWMFFLFGSGFLGECDLYNGEISLLFNSNEPLFLGLIHINNLFFSHVDYLVKSFDFSPHDLCDPECPVHQSLSSLNGHEIFPFSEEESEGSGDVLAYVMECLP